MPSRPAINWNKLQKSMHKAFKMMIGKRQAGPEVIEAIEAAHGDMMRAETGKIFDEHVQQSIAHDVQQSDLEPEAVEGVLYRDFDEEWESSEPWLSVKQIDRTKWVMVYNVSLSVFTLDAGMRG